MTPNQYQINSLSLQIHIFNQILFLMQGVEHKENQNNRDKNTFSTESSKRDTEIESDQNYKTERHKYLQQRRNRKQQIKKIRKQQFGSSSSESEQSTQKNKPKQTIIKDYDLAKTQSKQQAKTNTQQEQFHAKHQAYIKQKLARKKQMIEQRKKQFGTSSSESDQQTPIKQVEAIKITQIKKEKETTNSLELQKIKQKESPVKRSLGTSSNQNGKSPIVVRQVLQPKGEKPSQAKKLTILVQSKKNLQWIEETLVIEKKRIKFINQNLEFMIAYVSKIKLFFTKISRDFIKLKITYKDDDYFFAISSKNKIDGLDQYYYVFSRVIQQKLLQIGFEPKKNEASIFPNFMNLKEVPVQLKNTAIVYGNILKKSQVLGNWEMRFVYITEKQIGSSKKPSDKPSMIIATDSISQLWSRFDIEGNNMLNIKIMYNSGKKTEFGIPISNLTDQLNWLYCFYRVINTRD